MEFDFDSITIGGGVIGLATAYKLAEAMPGNHVVLEKNEFLGEEQSGRNSGVLHAGHLYQSHTVKSKLCVQGNPMLKKFAQENEIPWTTTGKLTVAKNEEEIEALRDLEKQAHRNGVEAFIIDGSDIPTFEPNVRGEAALITPESGLIDASRYVKVLDTKLSQLEVEIAKKARVLNIEAYSDGFRVYINQDGDEFDFTTHHLINAAGLYSDRFARMVNPESPHTIRATRGDYCTFSSKSRPELNMNGMNVYPAPKILEGMFRPDGTPMRTVGTHLTPQFMYDANENAIISPQILVGPFAYAAKNSEDYNPVEGMRATIHSEIVPIFPHLKVEDLELGMVGIQAKIVDNNDFVIEQDMSANGIINLIVPSPGLTASLALAEYVVHNYFS